MAAEKRLVRVTAANLKHSRLYVTGLRDFFPPEAFDGATEATCYSSGGKRASKKRFSRSMIRDGSLMFRTWMVTAPVLALPTSVVWSQRKWRFQLCLRGLKSR